MTTKVGDYVRLCLDGVTLESGLKIPPVISITHLVQQIGPDGVLIAGYGWVPSWVRIRSISETDVEWT